MAGSRHRTSASHPSDSAPCVLSGWVRRDPLNVKSFMLQTRINILWRAALGQQHPPDGCRASLLESPTSRAGILPCPLLPPFLTWPRFTSQPRQRSLLLLLCSGWLQALLPPSSGPAWKLSLSLSGWLRARAWGSLGRR